MTVADEEVSVAPVLVLMVTVGCVVKAKVAFPVCVGLMLMVAAVVISTSHRLKTLPSPGIVIKMYLPAVPEPHATVKLCPWVALYDPPHCK